MDEAQQVADVLLEMPEPPDAITAMSDIQAAGVVRAAWTAGLRIPGDLSLTGWDDLPVARDHGLITVAQSLRDQGATCARAALREGSAPWVADWSLVVRGSPRTN